jgi:hypothetical protein
MVISMSEVALKETESRERQCLHRREGVAGEFLSGSSYIQALQRLSSEKAMMVAKNVGALFWSDAAQIQVWLCERCRHDLGL